MLSAQDSRSTVSPIGVEPKVDAVDRATTGALRPAAIDIPVIDPPSKHEGLGFAGAPAPEPPDSVSSSIINPHTPQEPRSPSPLIAGNWILRRMDPYTEPGTSTPGTPTSGTPTSGTPSGTTTTTTPPGGGSGEPAPEVPGELPASTGVIPGPGGRAASPGARIVSPGSRIPMAILVVIGLVIAGAALYMLFGRRRSRG